MQSMRVRVKNWEKYQGRSDRKTYVWFKFHSNFYYDSKIMQLSSDEKHVFIFIMCLLNQEKSSETELNFSLAASVIGISRRKVILALNKIIDLGLILTPDTKVQNKVGCPREEKRREEKNRKEKIREEKKREEQNISSEQALPVFAGSVAELADVWVSRNVKPEQLDAMLFAYPEPDWIIQETKKALAWEKLNPARRKKDFGRFLNNWLARTWDSRKAGNEEGSRGLSSNREVEREKRNAQAAKEALRLLGVSS